MPELPEVESARRGLSRWFHGATITGARSSDALVVRGPAAAFARALIGRVVSGVERRGKWLRISFVDGGGLFSHLGMSGKWVRREVDHPTLDWERARIDVRARGKTSSARYVDPRRLGRLVVANEDTKSWRALGPDPLADGLDARNLAEGFARRRGSVKEALMDQALIAGVGNIYATEALFRARIDPRSSARALTTADVRAVARAVRATLAQAIRAIGDEEIDYVNERGAKNPFAVYRRAGEPCPRCKTALVRVVLGGRGTTFCPSCQIRRR